MPDLLVILPVRHRPASLPRFVEAFRATAESADLVVVMDADDISYAGILPSLDVRTLVLPRMVTSPKVNHAAKACGGGYRALMFMGDDNVCRTEGWDTAMLAALDGMGGTGIVYCNDTLRTDLPCSALISSDIIKTLGWMCLPSVSHFFMDNAWRDIGEGCGNYAYLQDVIIEHLHPAWGKAPTDTLYVHARARYWDADEAAYGAWRAERMEADVAAVKALIR